MQNKIGRYNILKPIGKGGMANVYLAADDAGNKFAIKELVLSQEEPSREQRFLQEMNLYSRINSQYVVKFIGGKTKNTSVPYIVMEYVDGWSLKEYIKKEGGRLHYSVAARIGAQLCSGFGEIHAQRIIHRDIKSGNIMVERLTQNVKIIDFGIALSPDSARHTAQGKIIASVQYLAPELIKRAEPSIQSDIYALGILMFEMLTGETPFKGPDPSNIALQHQTSKLPDLRKIVPGIPISLVNVIERATNKDPRIRYEKMAGFQRDLETYNNNVNKWATKKNLRGDQAFSVAAWVRSKWFWIVTLIIILLTIAIIASLAAVNLL